MTTDFAKLLRTLAEHNVSFIVVGGLAVAAHGHPRATIDLDICYERSEENLARLASALVPLRPRLRGAPEGLPFVFDARTLRNGLNFTLVTDAGALDLLGELTGVGGFAQLAPDAVTMALYGHDVKFISLDMLERAKLAAGRPKDLIDLEALRELKRRASKP